MMKFWHRLHFFLALLGMFELQCHISVIFCVYWRVGGGVKAKKGFSISRVEV